MTIEHLTICNLEKYPGGRTIWTYKGTGTRPYVPHPAYPQCNETREGHKDMCTDLLKPMHDQQDRESLQTAVQDIELSGQPHLREE